jgi:hypothetical protein
MATQETTRPFEASLNAALRSGRTAYEWALQQLEAGVPGDDILIAVALHALEER